MKNILVIGGSYFIGKVFVLDCLKSTGFNIHVTNRGNNPFNRPDVKEYFCDRHDIPAVSKAIPPLEWHAVIDFCAFVPRDVNLTIESLPGKINHYILISTASVYETSEELPKFEDSSPLLSAPLPGPHGDYGYNKRQTEIELANLCKKRSIPYTILRPAFVYGQFNYAPRESFFFKLITKNEPLPFPKDSMSLFQFVFVRDVAGILIACSGNAKVYDQIYNLSADEFISYRKLVNVFEKISGKKISLEKFSMEEIKRKNKPLPFPLDHHELYSGNKIALTLDFKYTPFLKGMKETYDFYLKYLA